MSAVFIDDEFLYTHMAQAENLMLDQIPPERELKHHFSRRFRRKMRALIRYERRTPRMRKAVHCMKVAAAAFAVVLSLTFGALMSVEASRTRIIEIITNVLRDAVSLHISIDNGAPSDLVLRPITPTYVPEGYCVVDETLNEMDYVVVYEYENETETMICYNQHLMNATGMLIDTEDVYMSTEKIGSQEIQVIVKPSKNYCSLYWHDDYYFYSLSGNHIESDELLNMVKSIIGKEEQKNFDN